MLVIGITGKIIEDNFSYTVNVYKARDRVRDILEAICFMNSALQIKSQQETQFILFYLVANDSLAYLELFSTGRKVHIAMGISSMGGLVQKC